MFDIRNDVAGETKVVTMNTLPVRTYICTLSVSKKSVRITPVTYLRKGKAMPLQAWTGPEAPRFQDIWHMKVVRLSALRTGRLYPQEIFLVLISVRG